jgi:hypothetical protein
VQYIIEISRHISCILSCTKGSFRGNIRSFNTFSYSTEIILYILTKHSELVFSTVPGIHREKQRQKMEVGNDAPTVYLLSETSHKLNAISTDQLYHWTVNVPGTPHLAYLSYLRMNHSIYDTDSKFLFPNYNTTWVAYKYYCGHIVVFKYTQYQSV